MSEHAISNAKGMIKTFLSVTDRERDTILAALRHYQASTIIPDAIRDIANNDHDNPLDADEIDALCEDINCSSSGPLRVLVALEGGIVQGAVADLEGVTVTVLDYDTEGADEERVFAIPQRGAGYSDAYMVEHDADHDPVFIDAAKAADVAEPEEALESLRQDVKTWATDHPAMSEASRLAADRLEAQLPELLERKEAREQAEEDRREQLRADHAARVAAAATA